MNRDRYDNLDPKQKVVTSTLVGGSVSAVIFALLAVAAVYITFDLTRKRPFDEDDKKKEMEVHESVLILLLLGSIGATFCGSVLVNLFVQGRIIPTGFLTHYPGGVCGFGVMTGIILCLLFLCQIIIILMGRSELLRKYWMVLVSVISIYFVGQLAMNSTLDYKIRAQTWDYYNGPGLFEYMTPAYILQIAYLIILCVSPHTTKTSREQRG